MVELRVSQRQSIRVDSGNRGLSPAPHWKERVAEVREPGGLHASRGPIPARARGVCAHYELRPKGQVGESFLQPHQFCFHHFFKSFSGGPQSHACGLRRWQGRVTHLLSVPHESSLVPLGFLSPTLSESLGLGCLQPGALAPES